jgi:hypothetical protein
MTSQDEQFQKDTQKQVDPTQNYGDNDFSNRVRTLRHTWDILLIGGSALKKISVYDFYVLGKALAPLFEMKPEDPIGDVMWDVFIAHAQLAQATRKDSVLLPTTQSAATNLLQCLDRYFREEMATGYPSGAVGESVGYKAAKIKQELTTFDDVFKIDSPSMSTFAASQKGIYETRFLVERADTHLPESVFAYLPDQAKTDLVAAGRCLAFDVFTASAFHMWRALETVFGAYYVMLTGKTFEDDKIVRNWGKYNDALIAVGADSKITGNLDHIRAEYRNPVMHPNLNVLPDEAFSLFGVGISAITQVLNAIAAKP